MTTADTSKAVARALYEGYNTHDLQRVFEQYVAKDLKNHAFGGKVDREQWLQMDIASIAAIPDLKMTVLEQAAEGNTVFTRWIYEGTHTGAAFMGMPATGNAIRLEAVTIDVVRDGKVVEHNAIGDMTGFMQQFARK
jgi:steroid delta-isomerase-like uncharacterized protein